MHNGPLRWTHAPKTRHAAQSKDQARLPLPDWRTRPRENTAMDKLDPKQDGASPDFAEENIERLRELFPDAFTEGSDPDGPRWKVDFDALRQILGDQVENEPERYSFTWHGKARARQMAQTPATGTLRPCPEESVNWDSTQNLFIEGDNLEVLKLLQKSYHKQVKMIYIDPPYNTGGEFIYPDRFQDNLETYLRYTGQIDDQGLKVSANAESSGRYHTNWLNMMYPRLRLARNLLRDDGVIFVSIDDTEVANLRKVLDEIFGEENFVANAVWQKAYVANMTAKYISNTHDHLLVYARDKDQLSFGRFDRTEKQKEKFKNPDDDPRGPWKAENLSSGKYYAAGQFTITTPSGRQVKPPEGRYWRCNEETYKKWLKEDRIYFGKDGRGRPMLKKYLSEVGHGLTPDTWWGHKEFGSNKEASIYLKELFDGVQVFDTPKPVKLLRKILELGCPQDGLVLDFFSGSCPLAEAVLDLNIEDGFERRFIMVQLPEPITLTNDGNDKKYSDIAEVGRERISRVISRKDVESGQARNWHPGFRTFKLATSNIRPWDPDADDLKTSLFEAVDNIKPERSQQDVLHELLLKYGLDLAVPTEERRIAGRTVYLIGAGALIVCLADDIDLDVVNGIAALKDELSPEMVRVVFKDAGFADDVVKTNAVQILRQAGIEDVKSL
jgi:adenine-specific DNA-methyltransferase